MLFAPAVFAATFVVPSDRGMVRRADAIVVATPLTSYSQRTEGGSIETVTVMSLKESIKGMPASASTFEVHEPGGVVGDEAVIIAGVPAFTPGQDVILFLNRTPRRQWAVADLILGKFRMALDARGRRVAVRDEHEIIGWDGDLRPHREPRRDAERFLEFLRIEAAGAMGTTDYIVEASPIEREIVAEAFDVTVNATYTARSYTMDVGTYGSRWAVFPSAVPFYTGTTQIAGAPGGGATAAQTALATWTNDAGSNVNYVYGGGDSTHTSGLTAPDGANTILFERDLSAWGIAPFVCSGSSYGGTLGIGGVSKTNGTHTLGTEIFYTTAEADVEMNRGLSNCTLLFSRGELNSGVAHEVGHTLGFRHSDEDRASNGPCTTDPTLECSSGAIMTSSVVHGVNAALQQWDINAVRAVYPGSTGSCTAPAITAQPTSRTIAPGTPTTLTVTATGTNVTYQWYAGGSGFTGAPITGATGASLTVSPTTTSTYWVRVSNACGSVNSTTTTVTVSASCTPPSITSHPQSTTITAGQSTTLSVAATGTGLSYQWYGGSSGFTGAPIAGATGASLTVAPTTTSTYWVRVSNACGSANSTTATVTVGAACTPPSITSQPTSRTITAGQSTTLTVTATGSNLTYQWYGGGSGFTGAPIGGATGPSLTVAPTVTSTYWVRVSNACGSANSTTTTVTVNPSCTPPSITGQPTSRTITAGQSTTLTVTATGTNLTYQWYGGSSGFTGAPIGGATGSSLTVAPTTTSTYWVRVSNACGSVNSSTATVTVNAACTAPTITSQPTSRTIAAGQSTTLSVTATGSNLTYQWFGGSSGFTGAPIGGATNPTLTVAPTTTSTYWVRVSNACGTVNSSTALVTVQ